MSGQYELLNGEVIRRGGPRSRDVVRISDITEWHIYHEMVFDVITLVSSDGVTRRWLDADNSLIVILYETLRSKMVEE